MKVMLSHPMSGMSESDVMKLRKMMTEYLKARYGKIEIIDNYHHKNVPENAGRLWHLGTSIRMMEEADAIFFCPGWQSAKGCKIEYAICKLYNLNIIK